MEKQNGVTLIELLIAVTVIGVLTALTYPSYQAHVLKGHRSQVMADMIKIQLNLEESYTQTGSYDDSIVTESTCSFCETDTNRYKLEIDSSGIGMDTYKIIATPQASSGQAQDSCKILTLNAGGIGTASGSGQCW
ncbi:type IV pilin protein [Photobacterium marinum]|uniref:type IV pilin protein n=1 Tax=Photobacterium marinum TaxID=1056511 RepID=UPI00055CA0EA|nr:type IV pilin protein [Photobacterium marinum]